MIRPGSTMPTASLLSLAGQRVVIDCGLGVARGIVDQGMPLKNLWQSICSPTTTSNPGSSSKPPGLPG